MADVLIKQVLYSTFVNLRHLNLRAREANTKLWLTIQTSAFFAMLLVSADLFFAELLIIGTGNPPPDSRVEWVVSLALLDA
jgi:hypothetical protein